MKTKLLRTSKLAASLFLSLSFAPLQQANAQVASLIQDINAAAANSSPSLFTSCGLINTIFFVADNGTTGAELWKYDIASNTASLVKDINPGATGSGITVITANLNGNGILFNANDGTNGNELWKSDGTAAGTAMVMDINPGSGSSGPNNFCAFGGSFIFSADNGTNGKEPWLTNGNMAGTALLKDINPGIGASDPNNFTVLGTAVLFRANDGTNGSELWSTDMTAANTILVKDINAGSATSVPSNFAVVGTTLFFSAITIANGAELWKSDGTLAGTVLIKDINSGAGNSINISPGAKGFFTAFNNNLYFQATDGANGYEFWKSDGSNAGTTLVKDIQTGASSSNPSGIFTSSSGLFFVANDGVNGYELWMSDGTTGGTALLKDINPGAASSTTITTTFIQTGNGVIYFAANDGTNGNELYKTLGSALTTTIMADINMGAGSSNPSAMAQYNNLLYFSATNGITGIEPWKFDINAPTGIQQINSASISFEVYPNPCKDQLTIRSSESIREILVYTLTGQFILSQKINSDTDKNLDLSELKTGVYFIKVSSEKGECIKKLVVN